MLARNPIAEVKDSVGVGKVDEISALSVPFLLS